MAGFEWKYGAMFYRCGNCREFAVLGRMILVGDTWCIHVKCQNCKARRTYYPNETTDTGQAAANLMFLPRSAWK